MPIIRFNGNTYECPETETVLQTLLASGVALPHSCKAGVCHTCLLRSLKGQVPPAAQQGLRETLRLQGFFVSCLCKPENDMDICLPENARLLGRAIVVAKDFLAPRICRVLLEPATPLYYHAGQFINLYRSDGLVRSYSLASVPTHDGPLEIHVKRFQNGRMSNWIHDDLQVNDAIDLSGPHGECFYVSGKPDQALLLIGTGTGLAPLQGIVRDALYSGHKGPIHLYHGSHEYAVLYSMDLLNRLAEQYPHFHYTPCVSSEPAKPSKQAPARVGRANDNAFSDFSNLSGWRVFLCGNPPMVRQASKKAYLAGADMADIYADPFEVADLRSKPRS